MSEKTKFIIDWLSVSSKIHGPSTWLDDLGFNDATFEQRPGFYGYRLRLHFDGVSVHYAGHSENMGTLLEMSGKGCRRFETSGTGDYEAIFDDVKNNPGEMNITRLDIACDDLEGLLPLEYIANKIRRGEYVSKCREWGVEESSKGLTVSHGTKESDVYIRIYDKAAERGFKDGRHWVRCEMQLRHALAAKYAQLILDGKSVGDLYCGVLRNYLRYVEDDATRRWRCSISPFWNNFINHAEGIRIYEKPGVDYNLHNLHSYVVDQAGNSIWTLAQILGWDGLRQKVEEKSKKLNQNHRAILVKHGRKE